MSDWNQDAALQLFALGKVLRLWNVITPTSPVDISGGNAEVARDLAGRGFILIDGYRP